MCLGAVGFLPPNAAVFSTCFDPRVASESPAVHIHAACARPTARAFLFVSSVASDVGNPLTSQELSQVLQFRYILAFLVQIEQNVKPLCSLLYIHSTHSSLSFLFEETCSFARLPGVLHSIFLWQRYARHAELVQIVKLPGRG